MTPVDSFGGIVSLLLCVAWLLPLASFTLIVLVGPRMGKAGFLASYVATSAIVGGFVLSVIVLFAWLWRYGPNPPEHAAHHAAAHKEPAEHASHSAREEHASLDSRAAVRQSVVHFAALAQAPESETAAVAEAHAPAAEQHEASAGEEATGEHAPTEHAALPQAYAGDWYTLGEFGDLKITIGYYVDSLTVCMFCMVTLIASCIHFYAIGYMHDELHDVVDHEVTLADGHHLHRPGRFHRFFQYMSLFCFSMLGLVIAGNIAMVFVFWELVGICSYFLIGFYIERKSAANAANKAFIVNRVGDFGMIVGMMALWGSLGTFSFGDVAGQPGIFSLVRPADKAHALEVPDGMVKADAGDRIAAGETADEAQIEEWRNEGLGYWLLVVAGLGIFCGCVGKSAQFPLHVWLPDAMEGPTPVSALVHSATMVAAGVYLVGRFYPVFAPEVLLVIAYVGCITLFIAATIAVTAVDIKRVLAYSTVSQLGYMMLALGVGGWAAGMFHLFTHAFFKSLLFLGSGSVIHACHTNDMTKMGGLRHKMPWTAYTMLVGCLAIIGAGLPPILGFGFGLSGYFSKDSIIAQTILFWRGFEGVPGNPTHGAIFFTFAAGGAAITAFYMFRLWYLTFVGHPRDHHIYDHAHESPPIMYVPLVVLSVFAIGIGWSIPIVDLDLVGLLEQARPLGALANGRWLPNLIYTDEHLSHVESIHLVAGLVAFSTALAGFGLATLFYATRVLNPDDVRRSFAPIYRFLWNKWYFDELYNVVFVQPVFFISNCVSAIDKRWIDGLVDGSARGARVVAQFDDLVDRWFVDYLVNVLAKTTFDVGRSLRAVQTGRLRQYVMLIVIGTVALAVVIQWAMAGP